MPNVFNRVLGGSGGGDSADFLISGIPQTGNTVTATKGAKTRQGTWQTIQVPNPAYHNLPSGFTEVEYIQSSGSQYINTEVLDDLPLEVSISNLVSLQQGTEQFFFGTQGTRNSAFCQTSANAWQIGNTAGDWLRAGTVASNISYNVVVSLSNGSQTLVVNDTQLITGTISSTASSSRNHYLFALNSNRSSSPVGRGLCRMGNVVFKVNGSIVRNFIPCHNDTTNKYGLLDISNPDNPQFYGDANGGDFSAGAVVPATLSASGYYIPNIDEYGTWTVVATDQVHTATHDVLVDFCMTYQFEMAYKRTELECDDSTLLLATMVNYAENRSFYKLNNELSICCIGCVSGSFKGCFLVSKTTNGVLYTHNTSALGSITYGGETWYVSTTEYWVGSSPTISGNYIFEIANYTGKTYADSEAGKKEMAQDLLNYYNKVI